ncbi:MAG: hypothetical protein ACYTFK_13880 [Planctomycetota bacterium]|jgi:hypothetical protein
MVESLVEEALKAARKAGRVFKKQQDRNIKRLEKAATAAAKAGKELRDKMTQKEIWKQWIEIANDLDATVEALDSIENDEDKRMVAALLSAAYWHPINVNRKLRDPHVEGMCETCRNCQQCPRASVNGVCWHPTSDYWSLDDGRGRPSKKDAESVDKMFKVALDTYRKLS